MMDVPRMVVVTSLDPSIPHKAAHRVPESAKGSRVLTHCILGAMQAPLQGDHDRDPCVDPSRASVPLPIASSGDACRDGSIRLRRLSQLETESRTQRESVDRRLNNDVPAVHCAARRHALGTSVTIRPETRRVSPKGGIHVVNNTLVGSHSLTLSQVLIPCL